MEADNSRRKKRRQQEPPPAAPPLPPWTMLTLMMAAASFLIKERSRVNLHIWGRHTQSHLRLQSLVVRADKEQLTTKSRPRQSTSAGTPLWGLQVFLG